MRFIILRTFLERQWVSMNKAILIPILALAMLIIQRVVGFQFSSVELQVINDGLLSLAVLLGILTDPKKKK